MGELLDLIKELEKCDLSLLLNSKMAPWLLCLSIAVSIMLKNFSTCSAVPLTARSLLRAPYLRLLPLLRVLYMLRLLNWRCKMKKEYFVFLSLPSCSDRLGFPSKSLHWIIKNCSFASQHYPMKKSAYCVAFSNGAYKLVVRMATYKGV